PLTNSYLFAANNVGSDEALEIVPVEKYSGVPDYYLLKIENVRSFGVTAINAVATLGRLSADATFLISIDGADPVTVTVPKASTDANVDIDDLIVDFNAALTVAGLNTTVTAEKVSIATGFRISLTGAYGMTIEVSYADGNAASELGFVSGQSNLGRAPAMGRYKLVFSESLLGTAIDVAGDDADVQISIGDPSYRPAAIPLGDINGDGFDDYIAAVKDNLTGTGSSYARVVFGSDTGDDFTLGSAAGFTLKLTAPVLYPTSTTHAQTFFAEPGDYDGDGTDDILLTVATPTGAAVTGLEQAVYLIFGLDSDVESWPEEFDVYGQADVRIVGTVAGGALRGSSAGNVNGDGYDDLLVTQGNNAYLFYGKASWATGELMDEAFTDGLGGFTLDVDGDGDTLADPTLWHLTALRSGEPNHSAGQSLYYGLESNQTYNYLDSGTGLPGQTFGTATSVTKNLFGYTTATLSFKYYLETEGRPASYDQVKVIVINVTDGSSQTVVASNASTLADTVLSDPSSGWKSASVDLTAFAGKTIQIRFAFDSIDDVENQYEGWYVDDVRVVAPTSVSTADATFTVATGGLASAAGIGNYNGAGSDDLA
ncbi:MAG: immune inhibitor A, partial [Thermodesulfobacteriota bacterium]|nr:immune inhibitor A [Thermodesulfobacteriota bacterium]